MRSQPGKLHDEVPRKTPAGSRRPSRNTPSSGVAAETAPSASAGASAGRSSKSSIGTPCRAMYWKCRGRASLPPRGIAGTLFTARWHLVPCAAAALRGASLRRNAAAGGDAHRFSSCGPAPFELLQPSLRGSAFRPVSSPARRARRLDHARRYALRSARHSHSTSGAPSGVARPRALPREPLRASPRSSAHRVRCGSVSRSAAQAAAVTRSAGAAGDESIGR